MNDTVFHTLMGIDLREINMFPRTTIEEILQNVRMLISTVRGTVPLDRELGLTNSFIDDPLPKGKARFAIFMIETIQDYELRVRVTNVDFAPRLDDALDGRLYPRVKVMISDEYPA